MTLFSEWMDRLGFNGKQSSQAAEVIGVKYDTLSRRKDGEMTKTELLAMSAIRAGLEPWSPEKDEEIFGYRQAHTQLAQLREIVSS